MLSANVFGILAALGALLSSTAASAAGPSAGGLAPPPSMSAGGLAPPAQATSPYGQPMAPPPGSLGAPANATQARLDEAGASDSGRGLDYVYFDVEAGLQLVALGALHESGQLLPSSSNLTAVGPQFGVGSGLRLLFLTAGPRFRYAHFSHFDLWTLNLDLGWHVPLGNLEPYAVLSAGYAHLGKGADDTLGTDRGVSIAGFNARLQGGLDYYVTNTLSVGGSFSAEVLRLSRGGVALRESDPPAGAPLANDASTWGLSFTASGVVGLHF